MERFGGMAGWKGVERREAELEHGLCDDGGAPTRIAAATHQGWGRGGGMNRFTVATIKLTLNIQGSMFGAAVVGAIKECDFQGISMSAGAAIRS